MRSAKSGPNLWQIWQVFGPWASPYGANGHMTMTVHTYRPRQFHRTSNEENPSSGYRDMGSASLAAARPAARTVTTIPLQPGGLRGKKPNNANCKRIGTIQVHWHAFSIQLKAISEVRIRQVQFTLCLKVKLNSCCTWPSKARRCTALNWHSHCMWKGTVFCQSWALKSSATCFYFCGDTLNIWSPWWITSLSHLALGHSGSRTWCCQSSKCQRHCQWHSWFSLTKFWHTAISSGTIFDVNAPLKACFDHF